MVSISHSRHADRRNLLVFLKLKWIHVILWAFPHQIHGKSDIVLPDALLVHEILDLEEVEATLGNGLTHLLLLALDVCIEVSMRVLILPQRELLLKRITLVLFGGLWYDVVRHEEVDNLARELLKHFLGKLDGITLEFLKRHELDDVARHLSTQGV